MFKESNGNIQSNGIPSKKVNEDEQKHHFIEVCVIPDPEEEKICKRKWTVLHTQAMDSFAIKTPVKTHSLLYFFFFYALKTAVKKIKV